MLPSVSVVIPVYNGRLFLPDAIANVRAQQYPALELVIVDDGSTDGLADTVGALAPEARFLRQDNQGPAGARNFGIRHAGGELIAPLDVDDLWPPGTLHARVEALLAQPDAELVRGLTQQQIYDAAAQRWVDFGAPLDSKLISATLYRARVFKRIGGFNAALRFSEDIEWVLRASEAGLRVPVLDRVVHWRRLHDNNMTRGVSPADAGLFEVLRASVRRRRGAPADKP